VDLLTSLKVAGASVLGSTVMRSHLYLALNGVTAGDDIYTGVFVGVSDQVGTFTAATGAAVPNPLSMPTIDWMWWAHHFALPTYGGEAANNTIPYDIKSKRKLEELEQSVIFSVLDHSVTTQPVVANLNGRVLIALP